MSRLVGQWQKLTEGLCLIDGMDMGVPGRTGTYVIREPELTLIETGPSPSVPYILDGLQDMGLDPADVKNIIVTHIHLDHAGGAGVLARECPNAQVVVHRRGARHLADPSRLVASTRSVYGDRFDQWFDPVVPIPEERLVVKEDGDTLTIGPDCTLQFLDTPGHSAHHFSIYDPSRSTVFTGDTAGVRYHQTADVGLTFFLPSTSPNQFDPEAMQTSIARIRDLQVDRIAYGHYSVTEEPKVALDDVSRWIPRYVEAGEQAWAADEGVQGITSRLSGIVGSYLSEQGVPADHPVYDLLQLDFELCALGIDDYLRKRDA